RAVQLIQQGGRRIVAAPQVGPPVFQVITQSAGAEIKTCRDAQFAQGLHFATLHEDMVAAIGEGQSASVQPIGIDAGSGLDDDGIGPAVHAYAGPARPLGEQVGALVNGVAAAVDVQAHVQHGGVVGSGQVGGALRVALEVTL